MMFSDNYTTISDLKKNIRNFVDEREWKKYHRPKDLAISISIESAELLENFQWISDEEINHKLKDTIFLDKIKNEIADIIIYCMNLSNILNFDISSSIFEKIEKNMKKYPIEKVKGNYKKPD